MLPEQLEFPKFVPDQLLTSGDLNQLFGYLDEQNRITRTNLIGIGIVCGLNLQTNSTQTQVSISKGCGVTSQGYLITVDAAVYTLYRNYKVDTPRVYGSFYKTDGSGNKIPMDLWELKQAGAEEGSQPLDAAFLKNKVALLFVEILEEENKNCNPNSCDDKGINVTVSFLPLLVTIADAQLLMGTTAGAFGVNTYTALPEIRMKRWDVPNTAPATSVHIFRAYFEVLSKDFIYEVESKLKNVYQSFGTLVAPGFAANPFDGLAEKFSFLYDHGISLNQLIHIQYYYDFFSDLLQAYQEFRRSGTRLISMCCPDAGLFPRHLLLGEVVPSVQSGKLPVRHYFIYSPLFDQKDSVSELRSLFNRLVAMIENMALPVVQGNNTRVDTSLRITPDKLYDAALSDRSIPYYYLVNSGARPLFRTWNYNRMLMNDAARQLSYHSVLYNSQDDFVNKPLLYDLTPYDFLRVEGIIGKSYTHVLRQVKQQILDYRLPVDVIALNTESDEIFGRLTNLASFTKVQSVRKDEVDMLCYFQDLESMYDSMRSEILCTFCKELTFYYDSGMFVLIALIEKLNLIGQQSQVPLFNACSNGYALKQKSMGLMIEVLYRKGFTDETLNLENLFQSFGIDLADENNDGIPDIFRGQLATVYLALLNLFKVPLALIRISGLLTADLATFDANAYCTAIGQLADYAKGAKSLFQFITNQSSVAVTAMKTSAIFKDEAAKQSTNAADANMRAGAEASRVLTAANENPALALFRAVLQLEDVLDHLDELIYSCKCAALKSLKEDYLKRYQLLTRLRRFGHFTQQHPGIQHKAGVPFGGTFIIVYHSGKQRRIVSETTLVRVVEVAERAEVVRAKTSVEKDSDAARLSDSKNIIEAEVRAILKKDRFIERKTLVAGLVTNQEGEPLFGAQVTIIETGASVKTDENGYFRLVSDVLPYSLLAEAEGYEDYTSKLKTDDDTSVLLRLKPSQGNILDALVPGTVIADFYLPYRCCSDCPPVQYIINEQPEPPVPNQGPRADAGADQAITLPTNKVSLDGSASTDADGVIVLYQWAKLSGPGNPEFVTQGSAKTDVIDLEEGEYVFELSVTDDKGSIARDSVKVTVHPPPPPENKPPVADAGKDQELVLTRNSVVTLDGSHSKDEDGSIAAYKWTQTKGAAVNIMSPTLPQTLVTGLQPGVYEFELTVVDNQGAFASDRVVVTVTQPENKPPVANAGKDLSAAIAPGGRIQLDGSGSFDPEGAALKYKWSVAGGPPVKLIFSDDTAVQPIVSGFVSGEYKFELMVTDDQGSTSSDTVVVNVKISEEKSCGPLSGIVSDFLKLDASLDDSFKKRFGFYNELASYFKNLQGIQNDGPDAHLKFFIEGFNQQDTQSLLIKWLERLNMMILEIDSMRAVALELYRLLVKLSMYIVCIQKDDVNTAKVALEKLFSNINEHQSGWLDQIKAKRFTKSDIGIVKNIGADASAEIKRVSDNGESSVKKTYLELLNKIVEIIESI